MSSEFEKTETGQYHFFNIVVDEGKFTRWPGFEMWLGEKLPKVEPKVFPRLSLQEFLEKYEIPSRLVPDNCFPAMGSGHEYPFAGEDIFFVNKETGLIMVEIFFEEIDTEKAREKEIKEYKPIQMTKYEYERLTLDHPILNEPVGGIMVTARSWVIDSRFKRRYRDDFRTSFCIYGDNWDVSSGEPRALKTVMGESFYEEEPGQESRSVNMPLKYSETWRSYLLPDVLLIYASSGEPRKMTLWTDNLLERPSFMIGDQLRSRAEIPAVLDEPGRITF